MKTFKPLRKAAEKGRESAKPRLAAPRCIHIKAAKVGWELECASAVKDELTRRGYQVVVGNPESFGNPSRDRHSWRLSMTA